MYTAASRAGVCEICIFMTCKTVPILFRHRITYLLLYNITHIIVLYNNPKTRSAGFLMGKFLRCGASQIHNIIFLNVVRYFSTAYQHVYTQFYLARLALILSCYVLIGVVDNLMDQGKPQLRQMGIMPLRNQLHS